MASSPASSADPATPLRQNPQNGNWVIQKYGGTSVGKFLHTIAEEIVPKYLDDNHRVALVCSARSGNTKATGTTNLLLRAASEALRPKAPDMSSSLSSLRNSPIQSPAPGTPSSVRPSLSSSISSLRLFDRLGESDKQPFDDTVDQIKKDHLEAARKVITHSKEVLREVEEELEYDCERLRGFLKAAQIIDEISTRSKDSIMGVGERLSCRIVTAALRDRYRYRRTPVANTNSYRSHLSLSQGIDAELVSLESIIDWDVLGNDDAPKSADGPPQLGQEFYSRLSQRLGERLSECGNRVPVVTGASRTFPSREFATDERKFKGFFGVVPGSLLAQVGRGYSDLCAALCAVGTSASELQVWKEVDGIFTADPRKVPTARLLATITPEEAAELTYYGSEVIHPFTMEQVIRAAIPIRIKNVENPKGEGTIIFPDSISASHPPSPSRDALSATAPKVAPAMPADVVVPEHHLGPTAITIKDTVLVLSIRSNRKTISHGFFARIFGTLDKHGIVVDLISTSEVHVSMAIYGDVRKGVLERVVRDLKVVGEVSISRDMAILSLVGKHMKNMVGVAGKMFSTLAEGNINIEMISQGASEINISCVIEERDAVKALNLVHLKLLHQHSAANWS
ncbi:SPOSA6832_02309 [Sporobolomyces salmonicolor]|uniref:aspartate kinase n=1 Tax=Sporidiobolus salmonicolor TaxID=5005 RepID=A0A0D6ELT1_SPOSA|nr:SPOSA6832_02309 [Sporobolomyces salmonicolor]